MNYNKAKYLPFDLSEANQSNSLRWSILYKEADGSFTDQTGLFKCKDYFNDVVAKYHGVEIKVYGFDTVPMSLNEEGVWVLLSQLKYTDNLMPHLAMLAEKAVQDGLDPFSFERQENDILLFVPRCYFDSTYRISFLTGMIRIAHSEGRFNSLAELYEKYPERSRDKPFYHFQDAALLENGFKSPIDGWMFHGKDKPMPTQDTVSMYTVHDNGVYSIRNFMKLGL